MPVRGLRDTAPFHWDGIPGDPYGGINSASLRKPVEPNSDPNDPVSATRHLVDGGLASTMKLEEDDSTNDEGQAGLMNSKERDLLSKFLLGVTYPPAQRRAYDNELSARAEEGFELFHILGDNDPTKRKPFAEIATACPIGSAQTLRGRAWTRRLGEVPTIVF